MPPPPGQDPYDPRSPEDRAWDFSPYPESLPDGPPSDDPLVPRDFDGWVKRVIGVIRRSLVPLLIIQAAVAVIGLSYQLLVGTGSDPFTQHGQAAAPVDPSQLGDLMGPLLLPLAVFTLINWFTYAASIYIIIQDAAGVPTSIGTALTFALGRLGSVVMWGLVWLLLLGLGFVLILPGLYLAIVFFASFLGVVVVERGPIMRSFSLVNRRFLPTVGRLLVIGVAGVFYLVVISLMAKGFGPASAVGAIVQSLLSLPFSLAMLAVTVVTYAELRYHDDPRIGTRELSAELHR
jgi:hypothetical protein